MTTHKLYVPLESVIKIIKEEAHYYEKIDWKYWTLPIAIYNSWTRIEMEAQTIDLSVIDEMIEEMEEYKKESWVDTWWDCADNFTIPEVIQKLQEIKERLYPNK